MQKYPDCIDYEICFKKQRKNDKPLKTNQAIKIKQSIQKCLYLKHLKSNKNLQITPLHLEYIAQTS